MECPVCEHRQRKFICQSCVRAHLRELRAQIEKSEGERQAEVTRALKLLGNAAVRGHVNARRALNSKAKERVDDLRRALSERRDNLVHAYALLPETSGASAQATTLEPTPAHSRENSVPFSTQDPPSPPRRFSRLFHFPSTSAPPATSPPPTPKRSRAPDPLAEAKRALEEIGDALAETRTVLVRELAGAYELQEELRQGAGGREERVWTFGRMTLPAPDELARYKPSQLHTTLYNVIHFIQLISFYLGVKLPFVVGWGASSRIAPPFNDLFIPGGAGQTKNELDTINEDSDSGDATMVGVGTPWIVSGRGLGASVDGGWGKYTTPLALHLPSAPRESAAAINLDPAPGGRPHRNQPRSTSSPHISSPTTSYKRRPSLLSFSRVSAAAKYVTGSTYGSSPSSRSSTRANASGNGLPTRTSVSSSSSASPLKPRQRAGSVSGHPATPPVRARVASLAAMPSRSESPIPSEKEGEKDLEPSMQTPLQAFVAALTMLQYNAAYLAWTQGALNVGPVETVPGILELLGATVVSEGIGFASHATSAAQEHALPPPTRSFMLSFPGLLAKNIAQITGGIAGGGLSSHEDHGEWDLIEASEEEDGVG
ncbi:Vacuolar sorting 38 and autophagy-related subunit 14 [Ceratobasidium sp. AG-Ba]|nr:Vacuolar sorting 38 and autophagy-related subunit 14 [Ceratobasidium sp. AG-Ba]